MKDSITFQECIETLSYNQEHYGKKGLNIQIYFVAQMFQLTYKDVLRQIKKYEREAKKMQKLDE
ncbi:MAG: hypothetical protein IJP29_02045 [Lachnospiraceae bacterium]|nr:hypothetical protein [Lachnospiraceae bacterium]